LRQLPRPAVPLAVWDFVVSADPLEPDRVNVYEQWESDAELEAFRGEGPSHQSL